MTPSHQRLMELFGCSEEEADEILKAPVGSEWWKKLGQHPPSVYMNDMFPVDWAMKGGRYHATQSRQPFTFPSESRSEYLKKVHELGPIEDHKKAKLDDFAAIYGRAENSPIEWESVAPLKFMDIGINTELWMPEDKALREELKKFDMPEGKDDEADKGDV